MEGGIAILLLLMLLVIIGFALAAFGVLGEGLTLRPRRERKGRPTHVKVTDDAPAVGPHEAREAERR